MGGLHPLGFRADTHHVPHTHNTQVLSDVTEFFRFPHFRTGFSVFPSHFCDIELSPCEMLGHSKDRF